MQEFNNMLVHNDIDFWLTTPFLSAFESSSVREIDSKKTKIHLIDILRI